MTTRFIPEMRRNDTQVETCGNGCVGRVLLTYAEEFEDLTSVGNANGTKITANNQSGGCCRDADDDAQPRRGCDDYGQ